MDMYTPQFHVRKALEGSEAEETRLALFAALLEESRRIKHCMDQGLPPTEFAVARSLLNALTAAGVIVRQHNTAAQQPATGDA